MVLWKFSTAASQIIPALYTLSIRCTSRRFWFTSSLLQPDSQPWCLRASDRSHSGQNTRLIFLPGVSLLVPRIYTRLTHHRRQTPLPNPTPAPGATPEPASVLWICRERVEDQLSRPPAAGITLQTREQAHQSLCVNPSEVKDKASSSLWGQDSKHPGRCG